MKCNWKLSSLVALATFQVVRGHISSGQRPHVATGCLIGCGYGTFPPPQKVLVDSAERLILCIYHLLHAFLSVWPPKLKLFPIRSAVTCVSPNTMASIQISFITKWHWSQLKGPGSRKPFPWQSTPAPPAAQSLHPSSVAFSSCASLECKWSPDPGPHGFHTQVSNSMPPGARQVT